MRVRSPRPRVTAVWVHNTCEVVYQLVNKQNEVVHYGLASNKKNLLGRLSKHKASKAGQFTEIQVITKRLSHDEARTLEGALIRRRLQQAKAQGKLNQGMSVEDQLLGGPADRLPSVGAGQEPELATTHSARS